VNLGARRGVTQQLGHVDHERVQISHLPKSGGRDAQTDTGP
jgi:hypothetical protein